MLKVHCDIEGCKEEAEVNPNSGFDALAVPEDWFVVVWESQAKGELSESERASRAVINQFARLPLPEGMAFPPASVLVPEPVNKVRFQAFMCEKHGSEIKFNSFHKTGESRI